MDPVLQTQFPLDMRESRELPGIQPLTGPWLWVDEAYAGQMARRIGLLQRTPDKVLYQEPAALEAAQELMAEVLLQLPALGFEIIGTDVICPDGRKVDISSTAEPLMLLGQLLQNDFVLMEKRGDEHVLTAAVLCFPASWRLSEKAGRPLTDIHLPVEEYTEDVARRVQRLFNGIQPGRPLWRYNQLWYDDPELFQPRSAQEPRRAGSGTSDGPYFRTERQTLLRLPRTRAVVFSIHTYVIARENVPQN